MTEMSKYAPGTFSWVELSTTDAEAAKKFYGELFGWSIVDVPIGEGGTYTMLQLEGKDVAALYQQGEDQQAQGIPPHWLSHVTVADVNITAEKVKSLGGTMVMGPFDVMTAGRMGVAQDPSGATFALWQPRDNIGAQLRDQPNTLCWNELATDDADKARDFYANLFDWSVEVEEFGPTVYTTFSNAGRPNGGMLQMNEEWEGIPPNWMTYFAVEDCDASAEKAKKLGGTLTVPPTDIPPVGRFAVIQDPQGAVFSIIKMTNPE